MSQCSPRITRKRYLNKDEPFVLPQSTAYWKKQRERLSRDSQPCAAESSGEAEASSSACESAGIPDSVSPNPCLSATGDVRSQDSSSADLADEDGELVDEDDALVADDSFVDYGEADVSDAEILEGTEHVPSANSDDEILSDCSESFESETSDGETGEEAADPRCTLLDESELLASEFAEFGSETLPGSPTTKVAAIIMIMAFVITHGLSWVALDDLLGLIDGLFGRLNHLKELSNQTPMSFNDITCGLMFNKLRQSGKTNWMDLTLTFNTDGSPVFKSSASSIWPIQFLVNELPHASRIKNCLVAGLWFGRHHPDMSLFMGKFVEEVNNFGHLIWRVGSSVMKSAVHAICCCVDAPARAAVMNMVQFNGMFGCPWCYACAEHLEGGQRYMSVVADEQRTPNGMLRDMKFAIEVGEPVNGLKGPSPLASLPSFNVVFGHTVEYMHCILLGVTKCFTDTWFETSNSQEPYYIGRLLQEFVSRTKTLYSPRMMTFNLHQLLHIVSAVEHFGPLWAHCAFVFESGNGRLLKTITGAKAVPNQVVERLVMLEQLHLLTKLGSFEEKVKEFTSSLLGYPKTVAVACVDTLSFFGNSDPVPKLTPEEVAALQSVGVPILEGKIGGF
ncbi:hypothetical protein HPB50_016163 [Hyalomma asiaticum]|uniref:Uncharacterized protein n=1 Tax=Hyalomma asiaticum TaxID=266040 RepID=A0ACB7SA50_HYAAI|nr:hypothetical protein HPB50_016163 [Hyalomma asiaticum]